MEEGKTPEKILELLEDGKYAAQIAKILGISKAAVSQHIKKLGLKQDLGIKTVFKIYQLNSKLNSALNSSQKLNSSPEDKHLTPRIGYDPAVQHLTPASNPIPPPALRQRLHRLFRTYKLDIHAFIKAQPECEPEPKQLKLRNNQQLIFQIDGISCRITTQSLIVEGLGLMANIGFPAPELQQEAERYADYIASRAEQIHAIRLQRTPTNEFYGETKLIEIEIGSHPSAEPITQKGIIWLYQDGNKMGVWTDKSLGLDNLESNKAAYLEKLRHFTTSIIKDDWNIDKQLQFNQQSVQIIQGIHEELKVHRKAYMDLSNMAANVNKALKQRIL